MAISMALTIANLPISERKEKETRGRRDRRFDPVGTASFIQLKLPSSGR